jgi:hypothetical protein
VSVVFYYVLYAVHIFKSTSGEHWHNFFIAGITMYSMSFIAQLFLCYIFWELGTPVTVEITETEESDDRMSIQDFDDEAELQAKIWNTFNREALKENGLRLTS